MIYMSFLRLLSGDKIRLLLTSRTDHCIKRDWLAVTLRVEGDCADLFDLVTYKVDIGATASPLIWKARKRQTWIRPVVVSCKLTKVDIHSYFFLFTTPLSEILVGILCFYKDIAQFRVFIFFVSIACNGVL